jgi:hypothetical protein
MKASDSTEEGDLDRPFTPIVSEADIDHWFTPHHYPPRDGQGIRYRALCQYGKELACAIYEMTPPGPDQMAAIRKIREAIMTANAAIACESEVQSVYYKDKIADSLATKREGAK